MEPVDAARNRFAIFIEKTRVPNYWDTIESEADVRMKIIDPIFRDILGWPEDNIKLEPSAGEGQIDYCCSVSGLSRLIIEAKKPSRDLGIKAEYANRYFQLKGSVFSKDAKEGIDQGIYYCGQKSCELACVTNGRQWTVFRGARGLDGTNTLDGFGCVFGSLESLLETFDRFFELLAYECVEAFSYRAAFRQAEGQPVRQKMARKSARNPDSRTMIPANQLSKDLDKIMQSFFRDLTGEEDAEARRACFVTTSESEAAEQGLERISEDLRDNVKQISSAETTELTEVIKRIKDTKKKELVLLVGTKGAGKTTFIDRFFEDVLPSKIRSDCVIIRIDMSKSGCSAATVSQWLDEHFLEAAEKAAFPDSPPSYDEIQGMFFTEYRRWSEGHAKHLYETDKTQFKIAFGKYVESLRKDRPHHYIGHLLFRIVQGHGKIPCLVFDNADHFDVPYQEAVFNYAYSLAAEVVSLVILPITDTTSWQLSKQGPMQSFFTDSFFLPTPPTELVLRRRIEYIERKVAEEQEASGRKPEAGKGYLFNRVATLTIDDIRGFAACLQTVFINTGQVADFIGRLSNHDIRRCLQFTREVVTSPHVRLGDLLAIKTGKSTVSINPDEIKMAMIRGKYDIYFQTVQSFVQNLFNLIPDLETTPLLPTRILQFLEAAWEGNKDSDGRYVLVTEIVDYFQAIGIEERASRGCLDAMLKLGLCLSYDPTTDGIKGTVKVEISPSGRQHLNWSLRDWVYLESMAEVTPLYDTSTADAIRDDLHYGTIYRRRLAIQRFVQYLLDEDKHFCVQLKHDSFGPQTRIREALENQIASIATPFSGSARYQRWSGRVQSWFREKGYGFIRQANGQPDLFAHISDVINTTATFVDINAAVEYEVVEGSEGKRAVQIVLK